MSLSQRNGDQQLYLMDMHSKEIEQLTNTGKKIEQLTNTGKTSWRSIVCLEQQTR
jgi:Tol biopolymer transport system component